MMTRHNTGFWLVAPAFLIAMAFSTVPTPLYPLYAQQNHFSSLTITVVFAVYALGVIVSPLTVGHISDRVGRRRVIVAALAAEVGAGLLFIASTDLPVLIAGRFVTGLGVGAITATAYLHELHALARPGADNWRFEIMSGVANIGGLGVGPLIAGALAQWAAFTSCSSCS